MAWDPGWRCVQPALVCLCAQGWHRGSNRVSSPGQTMASWTVGGCHKGDPQPRHCLFSVGPDPRSVGGRYRHPIPPWERLSLLLSPPGLSVFANNLIDFSNVHMLALALEKPKRRIMGQRAEASGGLAPPYMSRPPDYLGFFPEKAESLWLLQIYCFNFPASMSRRNHSADGISPSQACPHIQHRHPQHIACQGHEFSSFPWRRHSARPTSFHDLLLIHTPRHHDP